MALLDDVKLALRLSNTAYNTEITDLINAARADLQLSGVTTEKLDTDHLIKRALTTYVKANFGFNNPDAERLQRAYDMLKAHLSLSLDYAYYAITFSVTGSGLPLADAAIEFNGETLETNAAGQAIFKGVKTGVNQEYIVSHDDYETVTVNLDVTGSATVNVVMV